MTPAKSVRAVCEATFRDHGGELRFFLCWLLGEVDRVVQNWFRRQARNWPALRRDVESLDRPEARLELRLALEVTDCLVPNCAGPLPEEESLTSLALQETGGSATPHPPPAGPPELRRRLHQSLFQLLEVVEIRLPAGQEVREAGLLLRHLAGPEAVAEFGRLGRWLQEVRRRVEVPEPPAVDRLLLWMSADLFRRRADGYEYRLSFRLYLRARLKAYCRQRGWAPSGGAYRDLDTAFADLGRERIGAVVQQAVRDYAEQNQGGQGQVAVPEVLELLRVSA